MGHDNWNYSFRTNQHEGHEFIGLVRQFVDKRLGNPPREVLEIGCGDGGRCQQMASLWPGAKITGVDLSQANIQLAEKSRGASPKPGQFQYFHGDYRDLTLSRYDLIVANSVLHLIPGSTLSLFGKIARELRPGGLLVFSMPYSCFYNATLTSLRRVIRWCRCSLLDRALLAGANLLYGQKYSTDFLRERLQYAYLVPERFGSARLESTLSDQYGLEISTASYTHASLGQLKHRVWCMRAPSGIGQLGNAA